MTNQKVIDTAKNVIGKYLEQVRKDKKLTLLEAAGKAGMSNSTANAIEKGRGAYTVNSFIAYCGALDIHLELSEKSATNNVITMAGTPPPSNN